MFNIKKEYLYLENNTSYIIQIPEDNSIQDYEIKSNNNYNLFFNINKHLDIQINEVIEVDIIRDGNCYYNNLSLYFTNSQNYNTLFRYILYKYCKDYSSEISEEFPLIDYNGLNYETNKYNDSQESSLINI